MYIYLYIHCTYIIYIQYTCQKLIPHPWRGGSAWPVYLFWRLKSIQPGRVPWNQVTKPLGIGGMRLGGFKIEHLQIYPLVNWRVTNEKWHSSKDNHGKSPLFPIKIMKNDPFGKLRWHWDVQMFPIRNTSTPQKTNISHLGKRKIIFKHALGWDMLVPWRVMLLPLEGKLFQWEIHLPSGKL